MKIRTHVISFFSYCLAFLAVGLLSAEETDKISNSAGPDQIKTLQMLPAVVEPCKMVTLSVPVEGVLMNINVREGDFVEAGQILATVDNRVAKASVNAKTFATNRIAALTGAKASLRSARHRYERLKSLGNAISDLELDLALDLVNQTQAEFDIVKEQHQQALIDLQLEKVRLDALNVIAPFAGEIVKIEGSIGQSLTREDPLLTIADYKHLEANIHVPIQWYGKLSVGDTCVIRASIPVDRYLSARVEYLEPRIDSATKTFRCRVSINNTDAKLPSGFVVRLVAKNGKPFFAHERETNIRKISAELRSYAECCQALMSTKFKDAFVNFIKNRGYIVEFIDH